MSPANMIRAACLIAGVLMGFTATHMLWAAKYDRHLRQEAQARLKDALEVIDHERAQADISAKVSEDTAKTITEIRYKNREVIRYVPQIVTPQIVERFPLPTAFVRLHDAAIVSEVPASAWELDGSPSDVGADQALGIIVGNIGTCLETEAQLVGLQTWVREQRALSESTP